MQMLLRHILGYAPAQAVQALVGFGTVAALTRLLSPEDYGRYALILVGTHFAHMLAFTWLESALSRFHARAEAQGRLPNHLKTALAAYGIIALGLLTLGAGAIAALPLSPGYQAALSFALAKVVLAGGLKIALVTRRAAREVGRGSAINAGVQLLGFVVGLGLVAFTPLGAAGVFAGLALAAATGLALEAPMLIGRSRSGAVQPRRLKLYAGYGAAVSVSLVFELTLYMGDRFVVAGVLGQAATGVYAARYGVARRLIELV
ncbi:MAG: lipopolysaccharide biosynthesis protein, partial [Maricaulaceae bacterium]